MVEEKVAMVILNYKVRDLTLECVESVQRSSYKNLTIYVVDNASSDGIEDRIKNYPKIKFFQTGSNLGYTGGNNYGIRKALADGADFIFILNPDTTIDPECIKECLKLMKGENVGVVGPKVLFGDRKTIWYAGGILDKENVLGTHRGVDEKDSGQYDQNIETDYVSGAAMMVKAKMIDRIGLFDDRYFLYYEDSDLCLRAKRAGFKIMYAYKGVVYHKNAQTTILGSPLQDYYMTRNRLLFAFKFLPFRTRFALLREVLKKVYIASKRKALLDFLLGDFGKGF